MPDLQSITRGALENTCGPVVACRCVERKARQAQLIRAPDRGPDTNTVHGVKCELPVIVSIIIYFTREIFKGEVYPKIKFSPVVVFWVLSRMVLVRGSCDAPFLLESQSNSRTSTETG